MSREKQIDEMAKLICNFPQCINYNSIGECKPTECQIADKAEALYNAGYRKQSENMLDIETVKKWLYEMAINNVGCYLEGDFSTACELIISRLDGLKRFAEEMKGGSEPFSRPHENGGEWISVEERLPEDDLSEEHKKKTIKVLVAIKAKNGITIRTQERFLDYTYSNGGERKNYWTWRFSRGDVTHWMPLPEPPKMKGGGE